MERFTRGLILLMCFSLSVLLLLNLGMGSIEPIALGNRVKENVIDLDAGASQPGYKPSMTKTGFVSPPVPQIMALSPSAMVHQARKLRDETETLRDQAAKVLQETKLAALNANDKAESANLSLEKAKAVYGETYALAQKVIEASEKGNAAANRTALNSAEVRQNLNESRQIREHIDSRADELMTLYSRYRIAEAWMNHSINSSAAIPFSPKPQLHNG